MIIPAGPVREHYTRAGRRRALRIAALVLVGVLGAVVLVLGARWAVSGALFVLGCGAGGAAMMAGRGR